MARYCLLIFISWFGALFAARGATEILNVSYDPTREFYDDYNLLFSEGQKKQTGEEVFVLQSHGGSGRQARAVMNGLAADVVTLALAWDIDRIAAAGMLARDWQSRLPYDSCPYTSIIVFLVRKGNPKAIKDWSDLTQSGIKVLTPNPKTSGGARWNYLAAYAWAKQKYGGEAAAAAYMKKLFQQVPMLDVGARASTIAFVQRELGDVLITWESEALLIKRRMPEYEVIIPSLSILAEPPVAVVDKAADKHGTRKVAEEYLKGLYSPEAQKVIAKHFFRPRDPEVLAQVQEQFPKANTVTIKDLGGWPVMQKVHFSDGGLFDQIYAH